jgi:hypothetical protein
VPNAVQLILLPRATFRIEPPDYMRVRIGVVISKLIAARCTQRTAIIGINLCTTRTKKLTLCHDSIRDQVDRNQSVAPISVIGSTAHHCFSWFLKRRRLEAWQSLTSPGERGSGYTASQACHPSAARVESLDRPCRCGRRHHCYRIPI